MKKIFYNKTTKEYTFSEKTDGELNVNVVPPRFSPEDRLGTYRRVAKSAQLAEKFPKKREANGDKKQ